LRIGLAFVVFLSVLAAILVGSVEKTSIWSDENPVSIHDQEGDPRRKSRIAV
jgi:hypothetical protein